MSEDDENFEEMKARVMANMPKNLPELMKDLPPKVARQHGIIELPIEETIIATLSWFMSRLVLANGDMVKGKQFLNDLTDDIAKEGIGLMLKGMRNDKHSADAMRDIMNKFKKE